MGNRGAIAGGLFSRSAELASTALCILLISICIGATVGGFQASPQTERWLTLLNGFLLGWGHIGLTFANFFQLRPFRSWAASSRLEFVPDSAPVRFARGDFRPFAIVAFCAYCAIVFADPHPEPGAQSFQQRAILVLALVLGNIHNLRQFYGISRLYRRRAISSAAADPKSARLAALEAWEKRGYAALGVLLTVKLLASQRILPWIPAVQAALLLASVSVALAVFSLNFFAKELRDSGKPRFDLRIFIYAFVGQNIIGGIAAGLLHNFEYLLLARKLRAAAGLRLFAGIGATGATCIAGFTLLYALSPRYGLIPTGSDLSSLLHALGGLTLALTFLHIYLDRNVFRFRESKSREHILPLLDT